jgi:hypothetical protein
MPQVTIRVFLCPHEDMKQQKPYSGWLTPAGAVVGLKGATSKSRRTPYMFGPTDRDGYAPPVDVTDGAYDLVADMPGAGFDVYELDGATGTVDVPAGPGPVQVNVALVPTGRRWLLPVHVWQHVPGGRPQPLRGARVDVQPPEPDFPNGFVTDEHGRAYAVISSGTVRIEPRALPSLAPVHPPVQVDVAGPRDLIEVFYGELTSLRVRAQMRWPGGIRAVPGVDVEVLPAARHSPWRGTEGRTSDAGDVQFTPVPAGTAIVRATPPTVVEGWPVVRGTWERSVALQAGAASEITAEFQVAEAALYGDVVSDDEKKVQAVDLVVRPRDGGLDLRFTAKDGAYRTAVPAGVPVLVGVDPATKPSLGNLPLELRKPIKVRLQPGESQRRNIRLTYEHGIDGRVVNDDREPVAGAVVDVYDSRQNLIHQVATERTGRYRVHLSTGGTYFVAIHEEGDRPVTRESVVVASRADAPDLVAGRRDGSSGGAAGRAGRSRASLRTARASLDGDNEVLDEIAAYPVMTEEVALQGGPPAVGGGAGAPGAAYGQTVEQVIRDVLGWRPSSANTSGFQAALAGAFALKEVEGHTEWTWQQRGYAVQADLGALTGAQASIYARAKTALAETLPLLDGLAPLDPAADPQDTEATRAIVRTELNELVTELAMEGGPRVRRVDDMFDLLLGPGRDPANLDPDQVEGQLGELRERFGLSSDRVNTLDEERAVTNFRVLLDYVLGLAVSWENGKALFSGVGPGAAFGTTMIRLSRALDVVSQSVDELTFALNSVFVDAAQRQVVELRFARSTSSVDVPALPLGSGLPDVNRPLSAEPPILLSDLLAWISSASNEEGRRLIQDGGKDGVIAFFSTLDRLRTLSRATGDLVRDAEVPLPQGMRTRRVVKAIDELTGQLDEAADLAFAVRRDPAPEIFLAAIVGRVTGDSTPGVRSATLRLTVVIVGDNFRPGARAVLHDVSEGTPVNQVRPARLSSSGLATADFDDPGRAHTTPPLKVSLINTDGTRSDPVDVLNGLGPTG